MYTMTLEECKAEGIDIINKLDHYKKLTYTLIGENKLPRYMLTIETDYYYAGLFKRTLCKVQYEEYIFNKNRFELNCYIQENSTLEYFFSNTNKWQRNFDKNYDKIISDDFYYNIYNDSTCYTKTERNALIILKDFSVNEVHNNIF